ncbi:MAG: type II secretion system protein [Phycisphaerales bacterium]|nr:type II secretion system protein [Phycisphaerales bacterium]
MNVRTHPELRRAHRPGFTIVELLVVVAIVGVLIAVLLPAIGLARQCAVVTGELSAGRQLVTAYTMYASDNRSRLLPGFPTARMISTGEVVARDDKGNRLSGIAAQRYPWRLLPYFDYELGTWYRDPQAIARVFSGSLRDYAVSVGPRMGLNQIFMGGSSDSDGAGYAFNPATDDLARRAWGSDWYAAKASDVRRPADQIVFGSSSGADPISGTEIDGLYRIRPPNLVNRVWQTSPPDSATRPAAVGDLSFRFMSKAVFAMFDGNARTLNWADANDMRRWSSQATGPDWKLSRP